jgi:hypothetical protein
MENLKQIQEFFSKPLEENTWPEELTSRYSDEYRFELEKVTPTYQDKPGRAKYRVIDIESGELKGTPVFGSISSLQAFADDLIKPQGGTQSTNLGEMDMNDPVLMKMRAAKDKVAKMKANQPKKSINPNYQAVKNASKIAFLKKEREQLMRDMEQEAEPEGGPIADEYGSKLNRIDAAIAKLSGRKEMTYDQAIAEDKTYASTFGGSLSVNEELNLPNYGKVTPPKGGASLVGQYNSIQGKSEYDTVIFDYQEGSDKPYGIVQVEGHGIYGSDLLKRLGLRQTKSWTAGVDVYIHDGNYTPVYVSEDDFKALLDFWSGGLDREAKAQADFYRGRGNTSGTIDEAKVDYDFSERELIRVLRQLKRGASTEVDMIKAFTKALGRDLTKDELFSESIAKINEATEEDKIDIVTMDVPLFIRVLEYAREDAQEDMDLHDLAEKAITSTKQQGILQMDDYDMLVGEMEPIDESVNLKQSKLSSSEYQKAKKLKAFNAKDWKWNADEDLYVKVIKESKNYMGKNQITKDEFANLKNKTITYDGSEWNVMDSNEFTIEIKNKDGDTKIVNYTQFTKKGLAEIILKKLKENKIK